MKFSPSVAGYAVLVAACLACAQVDASVVVANTRVVFPASASEVTVRLSNEGRFPSLVQVWIDEGALEEPDAELDGPFSLAPALFRLDAGKQQSLRLFHDGREMPRDRESLFWLNVLDMPPKGGGGNILQISLRSRIKLFYRPQGLPGKAADAHAQLTWQVTQGAEGWVLQAHNPTPYHVNLGRLEAVRGGVAVKAEPGHVPPMGSAQFDFQQPPQRPGSLEEVRYDYLDDFGAARPGTFALRSAGNG